MITSGAYVNQELAVEFGHMPPAFLPIGTRRLYDLQLDFLGDSNPVYITLPEHFVVPPHDQALLAARGVNLLSVPEGLSLGQSVVYGLNLIGAPDQGLRILHGDTLVDGVAFTGDDEIAVGSESENYSWAEVTLEDGWITGMETVEAGVSSERLAPIVCGYFMFSHCAALIRGITRAHGDFIKGILAYSKEYPVRASQVAHWFDFGHVQTFFRSRRLVNIARAFNTVRINGQVARKSSADQAKMRAEAGWFAAVPPRVRLYCARLIDAGEDDGGFFYETEYEYLPTISELFVFGMLGRPSWMQILESCRDFLNAELAACKDEPAGAVLSGLVVTKTAERLKLFNARAGFDISGRLFYDDQPMPSLMEIAEDIAGQINLCLPRKQCVMHGDFCFSNILYNSRIKRLHVIDPRGYIVPGAGTIYGDLRYDIAKLNHSITGRYDQIIAGHYTLRHEAANRFGISFAQASHHIWLETAFSEMVIDGIAARGQEIQAITIGLFLSMLPLHADRPDRQTAFIANALRLYAGWRGSGR